MKELKKISLSHGSGGVESNRLIKDIFIKHFCNELEDSALLDMNSAGKIAFTTDSFVVKPLFFRGGDIGRLAICGTVNDLCAVGAIPQYLSCGFIISEGTDIEILEKIAISMRDTAEEANVKIVCGDTKVISGDKNEIFINTSGIGRVIIPNVSIKNAKQGDKIILTGNLGDHQACIMSARTAIENDIDSDVSPLNEFVNLLYKEDKLQNSIHSMRDVTRGGLVTVLTELCEMSGVGVNLYEENLPVSDEVRGLCGILGLDPLYMGNEGKMFISVSEESAELALSVIRNAKYGKNACIIGEVNDTKALTLTTSLGVKRMLQPLYGEGLPRIC
ncbi:MAG: hydrogenase expression/formation protein HypE [Ruminococcus sp.]|jgi:hydrogenase expression/formation protein HypE|nr:hydrogenase expression/formation protein HypE [Ruminococcus sp.]